jgi:hypothetical protein
MSKLVYTEYMKTIKDIVGTCEEVTLKMQQQFPELTRVCGIYYCPLAGAFKHWWLLDSEEIIDPTKDQFLSKGTGYYSFYTGAY